MNIYINLDAISELEKLHLNASHFIVLDYIYHDEEKVHSHVPMVLFQTLQRKGYITPEAHLTEQGKKLYELLCNPRFSSDIMDARKEIRKIKRDYNAQYSEWIKLYPATATWKDKLTGKEWIDTRILRKHTPDTERLYLEILANGEYTHEEMCNALLFQIEMVKKDSMRTGQNKMIYFQGTLPYLHQQTFIKQIETMRLLNWKPQTNKSKSLFEEQSQESFQL